MDVSFDPVISWVREIVALVDLMDSDSSLTMSLASELDESTQAPPVCSAVVRRSIGHVDLKEAIEQKSGWNQCTLY